MYELVDAKSGESVSGHRTRQAAVDNWRLQCTGRQIKIYRIDTTGRKLIVEGTWHEATRE